MGMDQQQQSSSSHSRIGKNIYVGLSGGGTSNPVSGGTSNQVPGGTSDQVASQLDQVLARPGVASGMQGLTYALMVNPSRQQHSLGHQGLDALPNLQAGRLRESSVCGALGRLRAGMGSTASGIPSQKHSLGTHGLGALSNLQASGLANSSIMASGLRYSAPQSLQGGGNALSGQAAGTSLPASKYPSLGGNAISSQAATGSSLQAGLGPTTASGLVDSNISELQYPSLGGNALSSQATAGVINPSTSSLLPSSFGSSRLEASIRARIQPVAGLGTAALDPSHAAVSSLALKTASLAPAKRSLSSIVGGTSLPHNIITTATAPSLLSGGSNNSPIQISIQYWIHSANRLSQTYTEYILSAVHLSWMLTKQLIQEIVSNDTDISLSDVHVDKVALHAEKPSGLDLVSSLAIRDIQFHSSTSNGGLDQLQTDVDTAPLTLSSRAVCASLGNILLEIFTKGASSSPEALTQVSMPPAQRRKLSSAASSYVSSMVTNLLVNAGMPNSIQRLVCDLLDAVKDPPPDVAIKSLTEVMWDLTQMQDDPQHYLFDQTSSSTAIDGTHLFGNTADGGNQLFGRERELGVLEMARQRMVDHVTQGEKKENHQSMVAASAVDRNDLLCRAIFLRGYAGCGKSSLLQNLIQSCQSDWIVIHSKVSASHSVDFVIS